MFIHRCALNAQEGDVIGFVINKRNYEIYEEHRIIGRFEIYGYDGVHPVVEIKGRDSQLKSYYASDIICSKAARLLHGDIYCVPIQNNFISKNNKIIKIYKNKLFNK